MTQVLTISTPFLDVAELTENFAQRVDEERLMLPYPEGMPEGEWLQFNVLLGDGSIALAGVGRVQGSYDNGEEHPAEYRFDVVLDSLQLEGMHEVMFERLMMARASMMGGEPVTGEVSVEELERRAAAEAAPPAEEAAEATDAAEEGWDDAGGWQEASAPDPETEAVELDAASASADELHAEADGFGDHGTGEVDVGDIEEMPAPARAAPAPRPPAAPYPTQAREPGKLPSPHSFNGVALMRASLPATWSPEPALRPEAAQSSGYFDYQGGVPRPAHPPRPDLDPSQRVQAAPRPGAPWPRRPTGQHAILESAGESEVMISEPAPAFEDLGVDEALTTGDETAQVEAPAGEPEHEEW